jgi:hypothetical protein
MRKRYSQLFLRLTRGIMFISLHLGYSQVIHLIRSANEANAKNDAQDKKLQNSNLLQVSVKSFPHQLSDESILLSIQHGCEIRQLLDAKLQSVFSQVREEYDRKCGPLLSSMERDINQMSVLLQELNHKLDKSSCTGITTTTHESMSNLLKQSQRIDVMMKNLEYDWQMIRQSGDPFYFSDEHSVSYRMLFASLLVDQFDAETVLVPLPGMQPKTDAVLKHEVSVKESLPPLRPVNIENKENAIDGNLLPALAPHHLRPVTALVLPCRLKNDVRSNR